jgi:hypothetical protein
VQSPRGGGDLATASRALSLLGPLASAGLDPRFWWWVSAVLLAAPVARHCGGVGGWLGGGRFDPTIQSRLRIR